MLRCLRAGSDTGPIFLENPYRTYGHRRLSTAFQPETDDQTGRMSGIMELLR